VSGTSYEVLIMQSSLASTHFLCPNILPNSLYSNTFSLLTYLYLSNRDHYNVVAKGGVEVNLQDFLSLAL